MAGWQPRVRGTTVHTVVTTRGHDEQLGYAILAGTADSLLLSPSFVARRGFIPAAIPTKQHEVGELALDQYPRLTY